MNSSKDTITEMLNTQAEKQRQGMEKGVKFVVKLEKVYDFLEMHKNWAYSFDELSSAVRMSRGAVKSAVKLLKKVGAIEEKEAGEDKYYMHVKEMDVLREYRKMLTKKWKGWRLEPQKIVEKMKRKGLGNVSETNAS